MNVGCDAAAALIDPELTRPPLQWHSRWDWVLSAELSELDCLEEAVLSWPVRQIRSPGCARIRKTLVPERQNSWVACPRGTAPPAWTMRSCASGRNAAVHIGACTHRRQGTLNS